MIKHIKIIGGIFSILILIVFVIGIVIIYELNKIPFRQTKDYAVMYIDVEDVVDAEAMISPPEKYSQLLQIDLEMRKKVSEYMENNGFKLKPGKQKFIRINPTFDELVDDGFKFEEIT